MITSIASTRSARDELFNWEAFYAKQRLKSRLRLCAGITTEAGRRAPATKTGALPWLALGVARLCLRLAMVPEAVLY